MYLLHLFEQFAIVINRLVWCSWNEAFQILQQWIGVSISEMIIIKRWFFISLSRLSFSFKKKINHHFTHSFKTPSSVFCFYLYFLIIFFSFDFNTLPSPGKKIVTSIGKGGGDQKDLPGFQYFSSDFLVCSIKWNFGTYILCCKRNFQKK